MGRKLPEIKYGIISVKVLSSLRSPALPQSSISLYPLLINSLKTVWHQFSSLSVIYFQCAFACSAAFLVSSTSSHRCVLCCFSNKSPLKAPIVPLFHQRPPPCSRGGKQPAVITPSLSVLEHDCVSPGENQVTDEHAEQPEQAGSGRGERKADPCSRVRRDLWSSLVPNENWADGATEAI